MTKEELVNDFERGSALLPDHPKGPEADKQSRLAFIEAFRAGVEAWDRTRTICGPDPNGAAQVLICAFAKGIEQWSALSCDNDDSVLDASEVA